MLHVSGLKLDKGKLTKTCYEMVCFTRYPNTWWRHQMETFSALLAICAGNSPVPGEFPAQRPVTRSFDVFFDLHPNKRLSKQWWGWWFETPSCPLWRHRNDMIYLIVGDITNVHKQRVLMHRHQGLNVRHGLCHIYMRYLYIYELFIAFVCFVVCSLL